MSEPTMLETLFIMSTNYMLGALTIPIKHTFCKSASQTSSTCLGLSNVKMIL